MKTISTLELKKKIESGEDFLLVITMNKSAYRRAHIPGSVNAVGRNGMNFLADIDPETEIVVYCTGPECMASQIAYRQLKAAGYKKVIRYADGLSGWAATNLRLISETID